MKKLLSLMLALLMLLTPVLGMAEGADLSALLGDIVKLDFTAKYLAEGQRSVTDVTIQPGIVLLSYVPQDYQAAVTDLLDALRIQVSGQRADGDAQGSLRLILNDQTAADMTLALGDSGLYAASSFLGSRILRVTPEQLEQLADQLLQQMVAQGTLTQEQVDAFKAGLAAFAADPAAVIASLVGEMDFTPVMTALMSLLAGVSVEEVTEKPEEVAIDAAYVIRIPLQKEALTNLTTELAKLLWSMPVVQQVAASAQVNGQPLTEERLISGLNKIPGVLAEDTEIRVYTTEDNARTQLIAEVKLTVGGEEGLVKTNALTEMAGDAFHLIWTADVTAKEQNMLMTGDMTMTNTAAGGSMEYTVTASTEVDGAQFTPIQEVISAVWTKQETVRTLDMDILARIQTAPGGETMGLVYGIAADEMDLGDHAEENCVVRVALENIGDIVTVTVNSATDLAEAYITVDDAVEPLAMTEEEQQAFLQEITGVAQLGLITLFANLPESVQLLMMGGMGGW